MRVDLGAEGDPLAAHSRGQCSGWGILLLRCKPLVQFCQARLTLDRGHQSRRTMSRPFCSMICGKGATAGCGALNLYSSIAGRPGATHVQQSQLY